MVPLRKSIKVWYSKAQLLRSHDVGLSGFVDFTEHWNWVSGSGLLVSGLRAVGFRIYVFRGLGLAFRVSG